MKWVCRLLADVLYLFCGQSPFLSVALSAVITGCMHGVNLMLNGISPRFFAKSGNVSFYSGLLNSCTYIGSAISTYGIAVLSRVIGWNGTIFIWVLIAAGGGLLCLVAAKPWKNTYME